MNWDMSLPSKAYNWETHDHQTHTIEQPMTVYDLFWWGKASCNPGRTNCQKYLLERPIWQKRLIKWAVSEPRMGKIHSNKNETIWTEPNLSFCKQTPLFHDWQIGESPHNSVSSSHTIPNSSSSTQLQRVTTPGGKATTVRSFPSEWMLSSLTFPSQSCLGGIPCYEIFMLAAGGFQPGWCSTAQV